MRAPEKDLPREELERAIDTIAALLRAYGAHAFDLGEIAAGAIREGCESWAQRILLGPAEEPPVRSLRRDFGGVRTFLAEQRRRESEYVQRSLRDLRQAIWVFVRGLSRAVLEDRAADGDAQRQLERLATAVDGTSTEHLKREASAAVTLWSRHLSDRQERHRHQRKELQARLLAVQDELGEPEGPGARPALDPVTRLPTQGALLERLARLTDLGLVLERPLGLLVLDVDRLRAVNEGRGLPAGDALLRDVGRQLVRQFCRRDDFVARLDGGSFAVLMREATLSGGLAAATRARQTLMEAVAGVTLSFGVAQHRPGEGAEALFKRARQALARAKQGSGVAADE